MSTEGRAAITDFIKKDAVVRPLGYEYGEAPAPRFALA